MQSYAAYVDELSALSTSTHLPQAEVELALASGPMEALRLAVPIDDLRSAGTFFTGPDMAEKLWANSIDSLTIDSVIFDPAVGAGDLLLPALRKLFDLGVEDASTHLLGYDIQPNFVEVTRERLALASKVRGFNTSPSAFAGITNRDFLATGGAGLETATHIVINPPFSPMLGPAESQWPGRSVNAAAVFVEQCVAKMALGATLLAILPDVLRSGSRYAEWRRRVAEDGHLQVETLGQFDENTDIHVFTMELRKGWTDKADSSQSWPSSALAVHDTVADHFHVSVGSVVPHRHAEVGPSVPFLTARGLAPWLEITSVTAKRKYSGRLDSGPFVVVRRTSRPGEPHRARATLIASTTPVAVENHLIVLRPKDGRIESCRRLVEVLRSSDTTFHLDEEIRCRHLTVGSVRSIPWVRGDRP